MFSKNQKVTYFCNYDLRGTVKSYDLTIASCGKKQMVLVDDAGAKFQGSFFKPQEEQSSFGRVVARVSAEEAEAIALEIAEAVLVNQNAHYDRCLAKGAGANYDAAILEDRAKLHEPRYERA